MATSTPTKRRRKPRTRIHWTAVLWSRGIRGPVGTHPCAGGIGYPYGGGGAYGVGDSGAPCGAGPGWAMGFAVS
jgi:hypothetical protein